MELGSSVRDIMFQKDLPENFFVICAGFWRWAGEGERTQVYFREMAHSDTDQCQRGRCGRGCWLLRASISSRLMDRKRGLTTCLPHNGHCIICRGAWCVEETDGRQLFPSTYASSTFPLWVEAIYPSRSPPPPAVFPVVGLT
jgi:hypothetical protein